MSAATSILIRTAGKRHGPITRVFSPGDLGERLKPFVFLDYLEAPGGGGPNFGFHPHSGIATLTFPLSFDIEHETSQGQIDRVRRGGIEWMMAGGGIWHRAKPLGEEAIRGFQIWFSMPPSHENAEPSALFIQPENVPVSGPVTVLLGSYGEARSAIPAPFDANYLWVQLGDCERWTYALPAGHTLAWAFAQQGRLEVAGQTLEREAAVFADGACEIAFCAQGDCAFLLGSALRHPYPLVLGSHSVHTSREALERGTQRIAQLRPL